MTKSRGRHALKRRTKQTIVDAFVSEGCTAVERSAGAVTYTALKLSDTHINSVANVYGSKRGAATIWVKDETWQLLKDWGAVTATEVDADLRRVTDISGYKRGMDWSIEIHDDVDPVITSTIRASIEVAKKADIARLTRVAEAEEKAAKAKAKADEMAAKRRSAF